MSTICIKSKNNVTSDPHWLLLNLKDKINMFLDKIINYTWKNIKKSYTNNKFKISAPTWNVEFELPDGSDSA